MLLIIFLVPFLFISKCSGVIYRLNESEYSRMPPLFSLDEYSGCLQEEGGVYCMLQLHLHAGEDNTLINVITNYSMYDIKHYNHSIIDRGVCVRRTCGKYTSDETVDLERALEACLNDSIRREFGLEARLSKMLYCDRENEPMDINMLDWTVFWAVITIVFINIFGSCYDYFMNNRNSKEEKLNGNKYILCFSIKQNWMYLTNTDLSHDLTNEKTRHLHLLHGVRTIACIIVILSHAFLLIAAGFTANPHDFEKSYNNPLYHIVYNGMSIVQIFFVISGFLMVYNLLYIEKRRRLTIWDVPKIFIFRIIRVLPVLMLTLALAMTWMRHAGSGPLWKLFVTGSLVADCQRYWWQTLLFIGNYVPDNRYCIIPTWHLSADMHITLICLTAYALTRGVRQRRTLAALLVLGVLAPVAHILLQDLDAIMIMKPEFYRTLISPTFRFMHILSHNNVPSFIIGMFTAMELHDWYNKGCKPSHSRMVRCIPYMAILSIIAIFLSGMMFYREVPRPPVWCRMLYGAAVRPVFALICRAALLAMVKTTTHMRRVLEWRGWAVPSKLSYSVFLSHMLVVHALLAARHHLTTAAYYNVALFHVAVTVISFTISLPIHLLVEAPCDRLLRLVRDQHTDMQGYRKTD